MQTTVFIVWSEESMPEEIRAATRREAAEIYATGLIVVPQSPGIMSDQSFYIAVARSDADGGIQRFSVSISLSTQCLTPDDVDEA